MAFVHDVVKRWAPGRVISPRVVTLFQLVGRDFRDRNLEEAVGESQQWLGQGERWQIPLHASDEADRLLAVMAELLIGEPRLVTGRFQGVVIMGATLSAMRARLHYLQSMSVSYDELFAATGQRPLNDDEQCEISALGRDPTRLTEKDAAKIMFAKHTNHGRVVAAWMKPDGSRPTTEDTVEVLLNVFSDLRSWLFISHQPFGVRQALTVLRALRRRSVEGQHTVDFAWGPRTSRDITKMGLVLDEAARLLYELNQLPDDCCTAEGSPVR